MSRSETPVAPSPVRQSVTPIGVNISEHQATELAAAWLKDETGWTLPVRAVVYVPAGRAGGPEGYLIDHPARWMVVFKCETPEGFHPDQITALVNPITGEVESAPMM